MDIQRVERVRAVLAQSQLDAMVLRLPENIVMCCGCWPLNGFSYAVVTAEQGPAAMIAPSCEDLEMTTAWAPDVRYFPWPRLNMPDPICAIENHLRDIASSLHIDKGRIGYEGSFDTVAPAHNAGEVLVPSESSNARLKQMLPAAQWVDATSILNTLRATKTQQEIERLRVAHRVASFGIDAFHQAVHPGVREVELASLVYTACLTRGAALNNVQLINVFPQISSGSNAHRAWRPIVTTGNRALQDGEIAVLELAVCVDGFWADVTRVKGAGRASAIQQRAFAAVHQAQTAACEAIREGVRASDVHDQATRVLIDAGFEKQVVHLTGHGLGFRYHEPEPMLMPGNKHIFAIGHVCSVEPGLYDPQWGGIRLENNIAVQADGIVALTQSPRSL